MCYKQKCKDVSLNLAHPVDAIASCQKSKVVDVLYYGLGCDQLNA